MKAAAHRPFLDLTERSSRARLSCRRGRRSGGAPTRCSCVPQAALPASHMLSLPPHLPTIHMLSLPPHLPAILFALAALHRLLNYVLTPLSQRHRSLALNGRKQNDAINTPPRLAAVRAASADAHLPIKKKRDPRTHSHPAALNRAASLCDSGQCEQLCRFNPEHVMPIIIRSWLRVPRTTLWHSKRRQQTKRRAACHSHHPQIVQLLSNLRLHNRFILGALAERSPALVSALRTALLLTSYMDSKKSSLSVT
jgi:hypothetical protein